MDAFAENMERKMNMKLEDGIKSLKVQKLQFQNSIYYDSYTDADDMKMSNDMSVLAIDMAINALERRIPKKPIGLSTNEDGSRTGNCPLCGKPVNNRYDKFFHDAYKCGQGIDWSEEDRNER